MAGRPMGKTRGVDDPWLTITDRGWTWKVLQAHSSDPDKPYASWYCAVTSPYATDFGDTYISDISGVVIQRDPSVPDSALPKHLR